MNKYNKTRLNASAFSSEFSTGLFYFEIWAIKLVLGLESNLF